MRHPSNIGNHPVLPDRENLEGVFEAMLHCLPENQHEAWRKRWAEACRVDRKRRDYDRDWDRSLATISWGGQGGG